MAFLERGIQYCSLIVVYLLHSKNQSVNILIDKSSRIDGSERVLYMQTSPYFQRDFRILTNESEIQRLQWRLDPNLQKFKLEFKRQIMFKKIQFIGKQSLWRRGNVTFVRTSQTWADPKIPSWRCQVCSVRVRQKSIIFSRNLHRDFTFFQESQEPRQPSPLIRTSLPDPTVCELLALGCP